jgi:hypothetical protein
MKQDIQNAWYALDEEEDEDKALDLALPWAMTDWEASTICALVYLYTGKSDLCDEWTIKAGELGARESWFAEQIESDDFAILICRFDTLITLGKEDIAPIDVQMALQRYLVDGTLEFALYYSIKALRNLWESKFIDGEISKLSDFLVAWILISKFDDDTISNILVNLNICTSGALSTYESSSLVQLIEDSLVGRG